jgi:hypothetical protein
MMDAQPSVSDDANSAAMLDDLSEGFSTDENSAIVDDAKRVVSGLRSGVRAVIDACVLTATTCQRFPDSIDEFLDVLVAGNIISRAERRLGPASPKLSKLRTIGNHAELLNREEVFPHLVSGFTVIHQLLVLYKKLDGNDEARVRKLVDIIRLQPTLSMDFLKEQTDIAKKSTPPEVPNEPSAFEGDPCNTDSALEMGRGKYDLVLLSPDSRDVRRLSEDYPESGDSPRCLRVHEDVDADSIAVVIARLVDLPVIINRLLSYCGIDRVSRVMLVREPLDRDVTDAEVVVVADRGRRQFELPRDFAWPAKGEPIDGISIATRLAPHSSNRLHLFAPRKCDGWSSVIGDENWKRIDE